MNRTSFFYISIFAISFCCNSIKTESNEEDTNDLSSSIPVKQSIDSTVQVTDFLDGCPNLNIWLGGIVGVNKSDSAGLYYFGECLNVEKTYRLIWAPRGGFDYRRSLKYDDLKAKFAAGKKDSYKEFDIYSFLIPLIDSETMEDEHEDYTPYPVPVFVYKRGNKTWELIKTDTVNNLHEFGQLQLETVFEK